MRNLLLALLVATPVLAQERIVFDANVFDTGAPPDDMRILVRSWPISTGIDQVTQTVTITWPGSAPPEVLPLSSIIHLERARTFEDMPDELFAVLDSGRRILLCQGDQTAEKVRLAVAVVGRQIVSLPMGEGHATRPPSDPPSPTLSLSAGATAMTTVDLRATAVQSTGAHVTGEREGASVARSSAGSVEKRSVDQLIKTHMPLFRSCYETGLVQRPDLAGRITVGFVIVSSGAVGAATIQASTLEDKSVEACIREKIMQIRFPAPSGNTTVQVSYPFVFTTN
jgi:hypothetical protein